MVLFLSIFLFYFMFPLSNAQAPPSPGYYPGSRIGSTPFDQVLTNLWGPQHQTLDQAGILTIWLDKETGSGFKSLRPYSYGYFGAAMKLQPGYTAGVITCFYLSNNEEYPGNHDEIDIEFLGTTGDKDKPYVLQTNVYSKGSGDGNNTTGREVKFYMWFDPTQDFHNYAIVWSQNEIIFFVDDVPIRRYPKNSDETFPSRPMSVYGSIWDASEWATDNGKYKADYSYQPFVGKYCNFKIKACAASASVSCRPVTGYHLGSVGLSRRQNASLAWVQGICKVYDYCQDMQRDHSLTPECYL